MNLCIRTLAPAALLLAALFNPLAAAAGDGHDHGAPMPAGGGAAPRHGAPPRGDSPAAGHALGGPLIGP